jgi:serine/threonine protein kinase/WD40 repeat protein
MGSVYLAHDTELDRPVALKVPRVAPADDPDGMARFQREARAAAALRHPHICPVYDVGQIDGVPYLTMAYVDGRTLADVVRDGPPLPPREAAALVRRLALALEFAHRQGVLHRDLKPANVLLNADGEPAITDFGLARRMNRPDERLTPSGAVLGTPAYMSLEQVQGRSDEIGPAADVYGLGAILYELVTGHPPFRGTMASVLAQVVSAEPERPSLLRPDLDPQLEAIVMKAMTKKADGRYPSMGEFARALGDYLDAPEPRPAPGNRVARHLGAPAPKRAPAPPRPRRRWWVAAAALVLLVGSAALILAIWRQGRPDTGSPRPGGEPPSKADSPPKPPGPPKAPITIGEESSERGPGGAPTIVWRGSPDGHTLVQLHYKTAELWDAETGKKLATLPEQAERLLDAAFSPDGKKLAISAWKEIKVWDVKTAKELYTITEHGTYVEALFFSADGKQIHSVGLDGTAVITDAAAGKNLKKFPGRGDLDTMVKGVLWGVTPDTKTFVLFRIPTAGRTTLIDTTTGEGKGYDTDEFIPTRYWDSLFFTPDSKRVLVGGQRVFFGRERKSVAFFDLGTQKTELVHNLHTEDVSSVGLSPDGKLVASGGGEKDKTAIVWDLEAKKERARLTGFDGPVSVRFSPDGKTLVASSWANRQVQRYDLAAGKKLPPFGDHKGGVYRVFFCRGGDTLAVANMNGPLTLYDVASLPK